MEMTSGPEPRYTYAKPTEKAMPGPPKAHWDGVGTETSEYIADYKLPVINTQRARRNFAGYDATQYYTLEEICEGDISGTTETDSKTSPQQESYTNINQKSGKVRRD